MKLILENWREYLNEIQTDIDELVQSPGYEAQDVKQFFITLKVNTGDKDQILDDLEQGFVKKYQKGDPESSYGGSTSSDIVGYSGDPSNIEQFHGVDTYNTTVVMPAKLFTKTNCDEGGCKPIQVEYDNLDFLVQDNLRVLYRILDVSARRGREDKGHPGEFAFLNVFLGIGPQTKEAVYAALDALKGVKQPSLDLGDKGVDADAVAQEIKDGLVYTINSATRGFADTFANVNEDTFEGFARKVVPAMQEAILATIEKRWSGAPWEEEKTSYVKKLDLKYKEFFGIGQGNESWTKFGYEFLKEFLKQRISEIGQRFEKEKEWLVNSDTLHVPAHSQVYISGWWASSYRTIEDLIKALASGTAKSKIMLGNKDQKRRWRQAINTMVEVKKRTAEIVDRLQASPMNYQIYITQPTFESGEHTKVIWHWPFNKNTAMPFAQYSKNIDDINEVLTAWVDEIGAIGVPERRGFKADGKRMLTLLGASTSAATMMEGKVRIKVYHSLI